MERFVTQVKVLLRCADASQALLRQIKIQEFGKNKVYCNEGEQRLYWCYVLDGLVGAYQYFEYEPPYMHWATLPGQTFTGTKHEYSDNSHSLEIRFLKDTKVAMIHLQQLRDLMDEHIPILRLINVLRQRRFTIVDIKSRVMARNATDRYRETLYEIPAIPAALNNNQLAQYLNINPKTLYKSRKKEINR